MKQKSPINCELVTVWDDGVEIRTQARYWPSTGEVQSLSSVEADVEILRKEFIELPNEDTMDVCTTCHEYILKPYMRSSGKVLIEDAQCSNPDCESHN